MTLADDLAAIANRPDGMTVLDLDPTLWNVEAVMPVTDLTGSVWPMVEAGDYVFVHGFAGKHRVRRYKAWLVECLTCGRQWTTRHRSLMRGRTYCHHTDTN